MMAIVRRESDIKFPIIMRAVQTGLVVKFTKVNEGEVLEVGTERFKVGHISRSWNSCLNDWWEPAIPKYYLPDELFEI